MQWRSPDTILAMPRTRPSKRAGRSSLFSLDCVIRRLSKRPLGTLGDTAAFYMRSGQAGARLAASFVNLWDKTETNVDHDWHGSCFAMIAAATVVMSGPMYPDSSSLAHVYVSQTLITVTPNDEKGAATLSVELSITPSPTVGNKGYRTCTA